MLAGVVVPVAGCVVLVPFRESFPNTDAALVLLVVIVAVAALGNRVGGLLAALSSAASFDFFLTRPYEHFEITRRADLETAVLLLVDGLAVTELSMWGHRQRSRAARRAGYLDWMYASAAGAVKGGPPGPMITRVSQQLTELLELQGCRFMYGPGDSSHPFLRRDSQVQWGEVLWNVDQDGLRGRPDTVLPAEAGGTQWGRFILTPDPIARPRLDQRLVAVAVADHVAASLTVSRDRYRGPNLN